MTFRRRSDISNVYIQHERILSKCTAPSLFTRCRRVAHPLFLVRTLLLLRMRNGLNARLQQTRDKQQLPRHTSCVVSSFFESCDSLNCTSLFRRRRCVFKLGGRKQRARKKMKNINRQLSTQCTKHIWPRRNII